MNDSDKARQAMIDGLRGDMLTMTGRNYGCERESDSQYRDRILRKLGA